MPALALSKGAATDLEEIAEDPRDPGSVAQCARDLDEREACLPRLAEAPGLGRPCRELRPEYFRAVQGRHVAFYRLPS
jgi:plasmid stabilization system protein ParE